MKFENKGKWFNESEDTDKDMLNDEQQELAMEDTAEDLLAEDELDLAEEDIDDDSEGIFNKEDDKKPEQKNERHLFKKGDRVNALGNTGTIALVYYEDPAETRKRFKVLMDKNKKVEVFTEPELRLIESAQKNESWFDLYSVVSEIGIDWEFYKKKPKYTRNELKQATITKLKAKGKSFNNQDLEEALNRWYASESAQKNEAKILGNEIDFESIGAGFTLDVGERNGLMTMTLSGFSSNSSKKLKHVLKDLEYTDDKAKIMVATLQKAFKLAADKFDKEIDSILIKHGFSRQ